MAPIPTEPEPWEGHFGAHGLTAAAPQRRQPYWPGTRGRGRRRRSATHPSCAVSIGGESSRRRDADALAWFEKKGKLGFEPL